MNKIPTPEEIVLRFGKGELPPLGNSYGISIARAMAEAIAKALEKRSGDFSSDMKRELVSIAAVIRKSIQPQAEKEFDGSFIDEMHPEIPEDPKTRHIWSQAEGVQGSEKP